MTTIQELKQKEDALISGLLFFYSDVFGETFDRSDMVYMIDLIGYDKLNRIKEMLSEGDIKGKQKRPFFWGIYSTLLSIYPELD